MNKQIRVHVLQHIEFEDIGYIHNWIEGNDCSLTYSKLFNNDSLPELDSFDLLIIMGGPMGIYDYTEYPWLKDEKAFIQHCIKSNKSILGICLGAQLIADCLNAKVYSGTNKEIGWFEITKTIQDNNTLPLNLPETIMAFHWHGDTFEIPEGASQLYKSDACENQAFIYNDKVMALQFHLEITNETIKKLVHNCSAELSESSPYIQDKNTILNTEEKLTEPNSIINSILNYLVSN